MAVFKALIEITGKSDNYKEVKELLLKHLNSFLIDFKKNELLLSKSKCKVKDFDEVILLRDFATDLWNEVIVRKLVEIPATYQSQVLQKMLNRLLIQIKETLFLLSHDLGLSAISNVRLFMEAFAITKYILEKGEKEAEKFIDYGYYQEVLDSKLVLDPKFIKKYGEKSKYNKFYSIPYGWCSEEKISGEKLIKNIGSERILDFYRLTCNYIHASPYSLIHVSNSENPFFPISCQYLTKMVRIILFQFVILILDYCMDDVEKHPYNVLLSMLVPDLFKIDNNTNI